MMHELLGREGGTCGGKGGSMHIADFGVGMLGANGVVAANIVIAAGAAHALKLKREDRIVACFFGDGAINRGPFLEGLNWAAVFRLPVLFVCEDNGYAATTRTRDDDGRARPLRARARPSACRRPRSTAMTSSRSKPPRPISPPRCAAGEGPRFLHAKTYRAHRPYRGRSRDLSAEGRGRGATGERPDPAGARSADRSPASMRPRSMRDRDVAFAEMEAAYASARGAPFPPPRAALDDVQDIGSPLLEPF